MAKRAEFITKTGAIAATVGSAVGLGNIWRFPYEAGNNGGGAFLLIYLICVFAVGIPVMVSEFIIGHSTHKNPKGAIKHYTTNKVAMLVPYLCILASIMILSFYSVVAGWIMEYMFSSLMGTLSDHTPQEYSTMFSGFVSNPWRPLWWMFVFLAINFWVLKRGVQKGIEKISNILMPLLFVLLIAFCINSCFLPEAGKGLKFLFTPDFSKVTPSTLIGAMGQAFFSLSIGLGCMLTYSSYFPKHTPLVKSATISAMLDTLVAILASVMIFPVVFSYGFSPEAGPKLVFEVLPSIFTKFPLSGFWCTIFFLLLFFASLSSTISMSEIFISFVCEEHKMRRTKATVLNTVIALGLGTLCCLSFGPLSDLTILDNTIFDLFNNISSNILLPIGGIAFSLFVGWGIKWEIVVKELTDDGKRKITLLKPLIFCIRVVAPTAVIIIFLSGLGVFNFILK